MDQEHKAAQGRKHHLIIASLLFSAIAVLYGAYWALVLNQQESTDDANVEGHMVQITPEISGTVVKVAVDDTQHVKAGQVLVSLDNSDAQLAFERSRNEFAQTVRQTRQLMANHQQLAAQVALRATELVRAEADLKRRRQLVGSDALSTEELDHAQDAVASAKAALKVASEQSNASMVLIGNDVLAQQPSVKAAASRLKESWLALQRTHIKAPLDGVVARRNVQVGQRLAAGTPIMAIVSLDKLWVDANFKENQLSRIRMGQPVALKSDLYGSKVIYQGKVMGLSAGTGSAFALLPPQNATGNWIKVVQRVPVRIQLDPEDLKAHPLRVGLSMEAIIDISKKEGKSLTNTPLFDTTQDNSSQLPDLKQADKLIKQLLAANAGDGKAH